MTLLGEIQATLVRVHPRTPTWQGATDVNDGSRLPGAVDAHDHAEQDGPETAFSVAHTHAYGAGRTGTGYSLWEPGPWPSAGQSTVPPHES